MLGINEGDTVEKVGGDYAFVGIVVAAFRKLRARPPGWRAPEPRDR